MILSGDRPVRDGKKEAEMLWTWRMSYCKLGWLIDYFHLQLIKQIDYIDNFVMNSNKVKHMINDWFPVFVFFVWLTVLFNWLVNGM